MNNKEDSYVTLGDVEHSNTASQVEAYETALFELNTLIERTEGEDPDPLTDATFRARNYFEEQLEELAKEE